MTFDAFCRRQHCTYDERDALAWQLAMIRAQSLYRQLRPQPRYQRDQVPA